MAQKAFLSLHPTQTFYRISALNPEHAKLLPLTNDPGTVFWPGGGGLCGVTSLSPEDLRDRLSSGYGLSLGNSFFSHCAKLIGPCGNWTYALKLINTIAY